MKANTHYPVMLKESLQALDINPDGIYVDATFGRGGHAQAILNKLSSKGRLVAFDQDEEAVLFANELFEKNHRFDIIYSNFNHLAEKLNQMNISEIDGILFDLGVSSPQLDEASRGFSFNKSGPLDMRMDKSAKQTAEQWISEATVYQITDVLREYGEERFAKKIANNIIKYREQKPITETLQLADIVSQSIPEKFKHTGRSKKHPATKTFQAIRIFINQELSVIKQALPQAVNLLKVDGRIVVISFHSLEDRIVKRFFALNSQFDDFPDDLPIQIEKSMALLEPIGKRQFASKDEIDQSPRSRSAVLRAARKNREGQCLV